MTKETPMKTMTCLSLTFSILSLTVLLNPAHACDTVSVRTTDMTGKSSTVLLVLQANSTRIDLRSFQLAGGATRSDTLTVGPHSASALMLNAQVSQGTLSTTCELPVNQCNLAMTVSMTVPETCPPPPPPTEEVCKHDNGNHWGEYRKLGMVVPPHSGKPNATKPCKDKNASATMPVTSGQTCPAQLSCSLTGIPDSSR
jgi:hypothetical protein